MFAEHIIVKTYRYEVVTTLRGRLRDAVYSRRRVVVLPLLTVDQVAGRERELVFHSNIQLVAQLKGEAETSNTGNRKRYATERSRAVGSFGDMVPVTIKDAFKLLTDLTLVL